mmetsp:Transcript_18241/g.30591  ORF Transcript_18241/g.30591 Transcript_18241/m.30591 type:complete len:572 (+) Transcript_18241:123-1838(+)
MYISLIGYAILLCAIVWLVLLVIVLSPDAPKKPTSPASFGESIADQAPKVPIRNVTYHTEVKFVAKPSARKQQILKSKKYAPIVLHSTNAKKTKPATELKWPPLEVDGSVPDADGYDTMPYNNLKVPRFWEPEEGVDLNKVGTKIIGEETIFLMIASYRDFQCHETIANAFERADYPERLFVGAVDQTVPGDTGCLDLEVPCTKDPSQTICKYRSQIAVYHMDAQHATGPVTARHIGDRLYRGQYFAMQLDAHCFFVRHWDRLLIEQWRKTHNEMAVLSSYLTDVQGSLTKYGDSTRNTRPIMCNSDFEGAMPARYLRHGSQPEAIPAIRDMPQLEPFWAAGFSFARGHFRLRVPYDAYQPMVFQGEEIAIGIRAFTHGYDLYAPRDSVVFHEYAALSSRRKKVHMFWENTNHQGQGQKSIKRATSVIHMANDIDPAAWDHSETERYGLGKVRSVDLFYKLFLINREDRTATKLCPFVDGGYMHIDFQPFLRKDGAGIDYKYLENYDTRKEGFGRSPRQKDPFWVRQIDKAMLDGNKAALEKAVHVAEVTGLYESNPSLQEKVKRALEHMS